jgi:hypothetical protein
MTFLQYVCEQLIGPPTSSRSDGQSHWSCPRCGSWKFHTKPHKPEYRDRFKCWPCDWWGDEADLLLHFHPREDYGARQDRLASLREDYDREMGRGAAAGHSGPSSGPVGGPPSSSPGEAGSPRTKVDRRSLEVAWADLTKDERELLADALTVLENKVSGVDFYALMEYCLAAENGFRLSSQQHLEWCQDPECDAWICRAARGRPPLTQEEIDAEWQAMMAKRRAEAKERRRLAKQVERECQRQAALAQVRERLNQAQQAAVARQAAVALVRERMNQIRIKLQADRTTKGGSDAAQRNGRRRD